MANSSGLNRAGVLSRVTVAALTAALVGTTTAAVAADAPKPVGKTTTAEQAAPGAGTFAAQAAPLAPVGEVRGIDGAGDLWSYMPNGSGGFQAREGVGYGWSSASQVTKGDQNNDRKADGAWGLFGSTLYYVPWDLDPVVVGTGWNIYDRVVSTSNLGGAAADDVLARDRSGNLYLYLGYGNGKLAPRTKVGTGWNIYTQITGKGDLTGDGKPDVIARDKSGYLWLYKGTGDYKAPFSGRVRAGTGWNLYNTVLSTGDVNMDGKTDLLGRDSNGYLWLYKGTGNAAAPFAGRVKVGTGWNSLRIIF